jgi:ferredoxin
MILDFLIDKLSETTYPTIEQKKCLYQIGDKGCEKCVQNCPNGAISIDSKGIRIDNEICNNCGICRAVCPTQSIYNKELGEVNILRIIKEKRNPVFSCKMRDLDGNIKVSCLNAIHAELLAALFILYKDNTLYFNTNSCEDCEFNLSCQSECNEIEESSLFIESLNKATDFVKKLGISPKYMLLNDKKRISMLCEEVVSRRELFQLLGKGSTNLAVNALDTIVGEDDQVSIRDYLLEIINKNEYNIPDDNEFFTFFNVTDNCNGCGICADTCPGKAWKIEEIENNISVFHNGGKCFDCGICISKCPNNAIEKAINGTSEKLEFKIKKEIKLSICSTCGKKFVPESFDQKICNVCTKKISLREKIASMDIL